MESPTTPAERSVRIAALAADADREALQAVLEAGALALIEDEHESGAANHLASAIAATLEPEVPEFERGERVGLPGATVGRVGDRIGRVEDRYLNERGEWEYHLRVVGAGSRETHPESALRFVEGVSGSVS